VNIWLGAEGSAWRQDFVNARVTTVTAIGDPEGTRIINSFYSFQIKSAFSADPGTTVSTLDSFVV